MGLAITQVQTFSIEIKKGIDNHNFCHEHEYYFTIYTFLTKKMLTYIRYVYNQWYTYN